MVEICSVADHYHEDSTKTQAHWFIRHIKPTYLTVERQNVVRMEKEMKTQGNKYNTTLTPNVREEIKERGKKIFKHS